MKDNLKVRKLENGNTKDYQKLRNQSNKSLIRVQILKLQHERILPRHMIVYSSNKPFPQTISKHKK